MDDRLQKAMDHANFRAALDTQRRNLRLRLDADLLHAAHGGTFRADQTLIAFVDALLRSGWKDAVVQDTKDNPIKVPDLAGFKDDLLGCYAEAMNAYHVGMDKLRKARSVKSLVGLD